MEIGFIFKIAAIGLIVSILNTILVRSGRDEQAMFTSLAGVMVVIMMLIPHFEDLFSTLKSLFSL